MEGRMDEAYPVAFLSGVLLCAGPPAQRRAAARAGRTHAIVAPSTLSSMQAVSRQAAPSARTMKVVRFRMNASRKAVRPEDPLVSLKGKGIGAVTSCTLVNGVQLGLALVTRQEQVKTPFRSSQTGLEQAQRRFRRSGVSREHAQRRLHGSKTTLEHARARTHGSGDAPGRPRTTSPCRGGERRVVSNPSVGGAGPRGGDSSFGSMRPCSSPGKDRPIAVWSSSASTC